MTRTTRRWTLLAWFVSLTASLAFGHHILGIPHYAYDEDYPQAPVITYLVAAGPYEVHVTGYPGKPAPGELTQIHAYVVRADDPAAIRSEPLEVRIEKDGLFGPSVVWGPEPTRFDENLHKCSPIFPEEGNYRIRFDLLLEGQPYEFEFPIVVGDPSHPLSALAGWGGAFLLLVLVVRAAKIKLDRRARALGGAA